MSLSRYLKTLTLGMLLMIAVCPISYANLLVFDNEAADNDWNNAANWFDFTSSTNDVLPGPADQTLINGDNLAVISTNSSFSPSQVWVSNASGGNVDIQADLTAGSGIIIGLSGQSVNPAKVAQSLEAWLAQDLLRLPAPLAMFPSVLLSTRFPVVRWPRRSIRLARSGWAHCRSSAPLPPSHRAGQLYLGWAAPWSSSWGRRACPPSWRNSRITI